MKAPITASKHRHHFISSADRSARVCRCGKALKRQRSRRAAARGAFAR